MNHVARQGHGVSTRGRVSDLNREQRQIIALATDDCRR